MSKCAFKVVLCFIGMAFGQPMVHSALADTTGQISAQDRVEILDLISRYSHAWDNKDSNAWTILFTDNATLQTYRAGELMLETSSNADRLRLAEARHAMFNEDGIQTRHFQTNTVLTLNADGSVSGETVFSVTWQYAAEESPRLVHTGVYRDKFSKTPSGWKFLRREVRTDHK